MAEVSVRLLGLGNDLLADDGFGPGVAREAALRFGAAIESIASSAWGFHLYDEVVGAGRLLVVDTVCTGHYPLGTLMFFTEDDLRRGPAASPHAAGLFNVMAAARALEVSAPKEFLAIAVEAFDCESVGGIMHPAVRAAISRAVDVVGSYLHGRRDGILANRDGPSAGIPGRALRRWRGPGAYSGTAGQPPAARRLGRTRS